MFLEEGEEMERRSLLRKWQGIGVSHEEWNDPIRRRRSRNNEVGQLRALCLLMTKVQGSTNPARAYEEPQGPSPLLTPHGNS